MHCFSSILWVYFDPPAPLPRWDVIFWNWSNSLVGQVTFLSLSSSVNTRRTFAVFQLWTSASPVAVTWNLLPVWHCMVLLVSECDLSTSCFYLISLWVSLSTYAFAFLWLLMRLLGDIVIALWYAALFRMLLLCLENQGTSWYRGKLGFHYFLSSYHRDCFYLLFGFSKWRFRRKNWNAFLKNLGNLFSPGSGNRVICAADADRV